MIAQPLSTMASRQQISPEIMGYLEDIREFLLADHTHQQAADLFDVARTVQGRYEKAQACRFFLYRRMDDGLYIDALCKKLIGQRNGLARAAQDDGDDGITLSIAYVKAGFTGQIQKKRAAFP